MVPLLRRAIRVDNNIEIDLRAFLKNPQQIAGKLTCIMASQTQIPAIIPTSTQGKILQRVLPSDSSVESVVLKNSDIQLDCAVECLVAEMMTHAAAIANAATIARLCRVMYRRKRMGFSCNEISGY